MFTFLQFYVFLGNFIGKVKLLENQVTNLKSNDTQVILSGTAQANQDTRIEYSQEIVKCCPEGLYLDLWYKCMINEKIDRKQFEVNCGQMLTTASTDGYEISTGDAKRRHLLLLSH